MFKALLLQKSTDNVFSASVQTLDEAQLPDSGDVTVAVEYSTLNYKDGLAITHTSPVVRQWPMVAGIDGAGTVIESNHPMFSPGDPVILNGFGVGETHWGCLAQKARLKGDWLIKRPSRFSARQAMAIGTAGYTAMLCVMAIEKHGIKPSDSEILVTGATGGVGSVAVSLLSELGYTVVASTGKPEQAAYLKKLGAADTVDRAALSAPGKPLQKERWAAVVDSVGSYTLANACAQTRYGGIVAACGLAQGMDFPSSVAPFILRGVTLAGIDSVMAPKALREAAWARLEHVLDLHKLDHSTREVGLSGAIDAAAELMAGKITGRIVVNVNAE